MLFKFLILFEVFVALSQAQVLKRYQSDTTIEIIVHATDPQEVCVCKDNKCTFNQQGAEKLCKVIMMRLQFYTEPSSYFGLCEVHPKSCQKVENNKPKEFVIDVVFDDYYLKTSPFFFGPQTGKTLMRKLMFPNITYSHPIFEKDPIKISQRNGITSMPIEYWGVTTIPVSTFSKYEYCYTKECHELLNSLCDNFTKEMQKTKATIMKRYLGCHITRIYAVGDQVRITWAMMFHHFNLISDKIVRTYEDLKKQVHQVSQGLKLPMIKEYKVTGFTPLDFCEIAVSSPTTQPWIHHFNYPTSMRYRTDSNQYYMRFMSQLTAADPIAEKCMRRALGLNFEQDGAMARVNIGLWASLTCYQKNGIKSCKKATERMQELWKKGRDLVFNDWANDYKFTLKHQGKGFQFEK